MALKPRVSFSDWDNRPAVSISGGRAWAVLVDDGPWVELSDVSMLDVRESAGLVTEDDLKTMFGPLPPWPEAVAMEMKALSALDSASE